MGKKQPSAEKTSPEEPFSRRILLTGGAGFIGSHVLIRLVKKYPTYHIVNLDRIDYCSCLENVDSSIGSSPNYKFIKGNIMAADLVDYVLQTERINTIMHFAAQSHVDNSFGNSFEFTTNNILGTHVLLEAAKKHNIERFIHVSTDEVYGEGEADSPEMMEGHVLEPTNPYAATKAGAEFLVKAYHRSFQLPTIITRSNNVYGPHQYPEKLIPKFIHQIIRSQRVTLHGDGTNSRNYLFVEDVARAFDIILHSGKAGQVYNIGGSHEISNIDVAKHLISILKPHTTDTSSLMTFVPDRPFNDLRYTIDSTKLNNLGWHPYVGWQEGLQRTVDWYLKHSDRFGDFEHALRAHPAIAPGPISRELKDYTPSM